MQKSIDKFLKRNPPSILDDEDDGVQECDVLVYGVDVSTAFTRKIEIELGIDRQYHTSRRGWLCDVSNKPLDKSEVYYLFHPS